MRFVGSLPTALLAAMLCMGCSSSLASFLASRDEPFYVLVDGYTCQQPPTVIGRNAFVRLAAGEEWMLMKFGLGGEPKPAWGNSGFVRVREHQRLLPVADGKILGVGVQPFRLTRAGENDESYIGEDLRYSFIHSAATQPDGSLVVAALDASGAVSRLVFVRFTPTGKRDLSFGTSGEFGIPSGPALGNVFAWSVRSDGSVDISAYTMAEGGAIAPSVRRYAGSTSITLPGPRLVPEHGLANWLSPIARTDPIGGLLLGVQGSTAAVWRFMPDGSLDERFDEPARRAAAANPFFTRSYQESVIDIWQAPGGGWIVPIYAHERGPGSFPMWERSSAPILLLDGDGVRLRSWDELIRDSGFVGTRLEDGGFLYPRLNKYDWYSQPACVVLKASGGPARVETTVVEYHNAALDHYFITREGHESTTLDDDPSHGWTRTGHTFNAWMPIVDHPGTVRLCRFEGDANAGPPGHVHAAEGFECEQLRDAASQAPRGQRAWRFADYAFSVSPQVGGRCAGNLVPVYRAYNRGFDRGTTPNHRYTADEDAYTAMVERGWEAEGVRFCVAPGK
jgi:hypothetical protein